MARPIFKQMQNERHSGVEISHLCWNSKFDLLALANIRGEVVLQRLFWKKAWEYPCPYENVKIHSLCWSPDGECLAISYANFVVHFLELENGKLIYQTNLPKKNVQKNTAILHSGWFDLSSMSTKHKKSNDSAYANFRDLLPDFPPLEKSSANSSASKSAAEKNGGNLKNYFSSIFLRGGGNENVGQTAAMTSSLLIFGYSNGTLSIFFNGYLNIANISLENCNVQKSIDRMTFEFSENFDRFCVCFSESKSTYCSILNSNSLISKLYVFERFGRRIGKLIHSMQYLNSVMKRISDSWEDLLLDVGDKFTKFAKEKALRDPHSTVGDELLIVLAFGSTSPELQSFLTNDLTEKSLKKLTQTLDNSYQNLRRLLFVNLNSALSAVFYHVTQLREFDNSLLNQRAIDQRRSASRAGSSCSLTCRRMCDDVERNQAQLGAFFSWLQKILISITEENVPPPSGQSRHALGCSTNSNINIVTSFIEENFLVSYNVDNADSATKPLFRLEKVGQYLKNEKMQILHKSITDNSDLNIFFDDINGDESEYDSTQSLVQQVDRLIQRVNDFLLEIPENLKFDSFECSTPHILNLHNEKFVKSDVINKILLHSRNMGDQNILRCFVTMENSTEFKLNIFDVNSYTNSIVRKFEFFSLSNKIIDLAVYNSKFIHILMETRSTSTNSDNADYRFFQFDDSNLSKDILPSSGRCSIENFHTISSQSVDGCGPYCKLAVSGTRKLGCLVYSCKTRLKLLEMEPDEETSNFSNVSHMDSD